MDLDILYDEFLEKKKHRPLESGFVVVDLPEYLFDFQLFIVKRALLAGKYAIFADCGLGKTIMQLVWAYEVYKYTKKPVLILAPLAVCGQTIKEGEKFNIKVIRASLEIEHPHYASIQIANYEQIENIDTSIYGGIVVDESSIIKNHEGAIRNKIMESFERD